MVLFAVGAALLALSAGAALMTWLVYRGMEDRFRARRLELDERATATAASAQQTARRLNERYEAKEKRLEQRYFDLERDLRDYQDTREKEWAEERRTLIQAIQDPNRPAQERAIATMAATPEHPSDEQADEDFRKQIDSIVTWDPDLSPRPGDPDFREALAGVPDDLPPDGS